MTTRHLGKQVYELLDGRLSRAEVAAAMDHLEECERCRTRWDDLRHDREAIQTSGRGIDVSFARHLLDRDRIAEIAKDEPRHHVRAARGPGRHIGVAVVVAGAVLLAILLLLWALGAPRQVEARSLSAAAAHDAEVLQVYYASSMRWGGSVAEWAHPEWDVTGITPVEARLLRDGEGRSLLVITLLLGEDRVTVVEQRGVLPGAVEHPVAEVADREVFHVSEDPNLLVWESGSVVAGASCDCAVEVLEEVVAAFPDKDEQGILDRIGDGAGTVADAITGG